MTLVGAVTTPLLTRLGDIAGKKLMILVVTAIATAGALLVAVANSFALVLVGRAMEGVLLALIPLVYSLMRDTFPNRILAFAVTIAASGVGIVTIAGPFLAGYLVDNHGWRSVFWFLAAEQAVGFVAILAIVPASKFRAPARLDVGGRPADRRQHCSRPSGRQRGQCMGMDLHSNRCLLRSGARAASGLGSTWRTASPSH